MKSILLKVNDINGRKKVIDFTDGGVTLEQHEDHITVQLDDEGNKFLVPGDWEQLQLKIIEAKLPVRLFCPKAIEGPILLTFGKV